MGKPKKTKTERQNDIIKSMLSEIADSYLLIAILPDAQISILERSLNPVHAITLDTLLERVLEAKERQNELRETGGLFEEDDDKNNL